MASSDPNELVGKVLDDRYRIEKCLGTGTMGAVYQAEHVLMKKRVALKVLHPMHTQDKEVVERFQREAQAAANIEHPNICSATDFGQFDEDLFYLVMEYLDGHPVVDAIKAKENFSVDRAIHIADQILSALEKAHEVGVVHRDLKPENILLVNRDGDPDFVKITDFGVAQVRLFKDAARLTQAGVVYGSPLYMSPQQASGKPIDHRADLYSVGIMMYELLTGKLPFFAKSLMVVLNMHISDPPPPFSKSAPERALPPEIERIVMKLLEKDPAKRYQSAREVRTALANAQRKLNRRKPLDTLLVKAAEKASHAPKSVVILVVFVSFVLFLIAIGIAFDRPETVEEQPTIEFEPETVATAEDQRATFLKEIGEANLDALVTENPEEALAVLDGLLDQHGDSAHVHYLRGRALAEIDREGEAFGAFAKTLELDTRYGTDPGLLDFTFLVFERSKDSSAQPAVDLINNHLKELANNRLATLAEHHKLRRVRRRALNTLNESGQIENLAKWSQYTIALRHAESCEDNRAVINQIADLGDPRALSALRRFSALPKNQCKGADCFECARDDVRVAIDKLEARQQTPEL